MKIIWFQARAKIVQKEEEIQVKCMCAVHM